MTRPLSNPDAALLRALNGEEPLKFNTSDFFDRRGLTRTPAPCPFDDLLKEWEEHAGESDSSSSSTELATSNAVPAGNDPSADHSELAQATTATMVASTGSAAANDPVPGNISPKVIYTFPEHHQGGTANELRAELIQLRDNFRAGIEYRALREQYCAVSLALNVAALWAPRFRAHPLNKPGAKGVEATLLHRDQIVIDVHWLWVADAVGDVEGRYADLVNVNTPFDFDEAARYACENWTSDFRAEQHFELSDAVQWQLLTLRSKKHVAEYQSIFDGTRHGGQRQPPRVTAAMKQIRSWSDRVRQVRGQEREYRALWCAREMLGHSARASSIGKLAALMLGRSPWEDSTVRQKLRSLDRHVKA